MVLDEFQNIRNTGTSNIQAQFQHMIDRLRRDGRNPVHPVSRLIVLGSAPQRLVEMFKSPTASLFGRVDKMLPISP